MRFILPILTLLVLLVPNLVLAQGSILSGPAGVEVCTAAELLGGTCGPACTIGVSRA